LAAITLKPLISDDSAHCEEQNRSTCGQDANKWIDDDQPDHPPENKGQGAGQEHSSADRSRDDVDVNGEAFVRSTREIVRGHGVPLGSRLRERTTVEEFEHRESAALRGRISDAWLVAISFLLNSSALSPCRIVLLEPNEDKAEIKVDAGNKDAQ
jgi:hypothetical protein